MSTMRPVDKNTITALRVVARALGQDCAFQHEGRFHFPVGGGFSLAVSPDDAGRFRVACFYGAEEVATLWSFERDLRRLADLALALREEVAALSR